MSKNQAELIKKVEQGHYSQGLHSHYVPLNHKPGAPTKEGFPELFKALKQKKEMETFESLYDKKDSKKK